MTEEIKNKLKSMKTFVKGSGQDMEGQEVRIIYRSNLEKQARYSVYCLRKEGKDVAEDESSLVKSF